MPGADGSASPEAARPGGERELSHTGASSLECSKAVLRNPEEPRISGLVMFQQAVRPVAHSLKSAESHSAWNFWHVRKPLQNLLLHTRIDIASLRREVTR